MYDSNRALRNALVLVMKWLLIVFVMNADGIYEPKSLRDSDLNPVIFATESLCYQVAKEIPNSVCVNEDKSVSVEIWRAAK